MIDYIEIKNYRNIKEIKTELSSTLNYIIEPNASGKTNFLESIYFSIFGSSFRNLSSVEELIGKFLEFSRIDLKFAGNELEVIVSKSNNKLTRKFILNGKSTSSKKLPYKFGVLLFAPHTVDLTSGEPSIRRKDLDSFLSICFSKYYECILRYNTVHKNRNALIKQIRDGFSHRKELDYWTLQLVESASEIYNYRYKFFNEIDLNVSTLGQEIYKEFKNFKIKYIPNLESNPQSFKDNLLQKYSENLEKEIIVGKTLYGPHKDDYRMEFNGKDLRYFGSRGQQRIGSFIFKLGQFHYYKNLKQESPVILIDDIMSELDETHRKNISKILLDLNTQIVLTGADINEIPQSIKEKAKRLRLK